MKVKVIIAALLLAGAGMSANAQSTDDNWFLQGQLGASYSLDGTGIGKLISPAGQIAAGKYFNPYVGARLAVSGWRKGRKRQQARRGVLLWCGHRGRPVQHEQPVLRKQSRTFLQCTPYCGVGYNRTFDEGQAASWQDWAFRQASA